MLKQPDILERARVGVPHRPEGTPSVPIQDAVSMPDRTYGLKIRSLISNISNGRVYSVNLICLRYKREASHNSAGSTGLRNEERVYVERFDIIISYAYSKELILSTSK